MEKVRNSVLLLLCLLACDSFVLSQQAKLEPFPVRRSSFIDEVKALRSANPKMSAEEFAQAADKLLDKHGINFAVSLSSTTCDRIAKAKAARKDPSVPLSIRATLKSVDLEGASLSLPEPVFAPGECGCYIEFPLLQMTDQDFVTDVLGRKLRFELPSDFYRYEAVLLDPKDKTIIKRKWRIPFRGTPIGISHDENVLYMAFQEPELADLSLMVFGEGVFQVGTRADADEGGKGKLIEGPGPDRQIRFDRWGNTYLVGYREPCK